MSKQRFALFLTIAIVFAVQIHGFSIVKAVDLISLPNDVPPGTMSYGNVAKTGLDPNIVAAMIGVTGLLIGSLLTIFGTYFLRFLDVKREDKREEFFMMRERKEKEYQIKQEIYKNFLNDLGLIEAFLMHRAENTHIKDIESFNAEWTKIEIKMNLVCTSDMRRLLDSLQEELISLSKKRLEGNKVELAGEYIEKRDALLDAIREDMDLFQVK